MADDDPDAAEELRRLRADIRYYVQWAATLAFLALLLWIGFGTDLLKG